MPSYGGATPDPAGRARETAAKHDRLRTLLSGRPGDALLLESAGALAWYLAGARVHVSLAGAPVACLVVHDGGAELLVFANEAARLLGEELAPDLVVHQVAWHDSLPIAAHRLAERRGWNPIREAEVETGLRAARAQLLPLEVERYAQLCRDAAEVLTETLHDITPGTAEQDVAASLGAGLIGRGADPLVLLSAGETRSRLHRHPLPTREAIGRRGLAVVCARRHGLIASVSRWVSFREPTPEELEDDAAILAVESDAFAALVPGRPLVAVFDALRASYTRHGFAADEWTRHHQGGAAGYVGRDPRVAPGIPDLIHVSQSFAFNPTAPGVKVEDTILLTETGVRTLSLDARWPTVEVAGRIRPAVLRR